MKYLTLFYAFLLLPNLSVCAYASPKMEHTVLDDPYAIPPTVEAASVFMSSIHEKPSRAFAMNDCAYYRSPEKQDLEKVLLQLIKEGKLSEEKREEIISFYDKNEDIVQQISTENLSSKKSLQMVRVEVKSVFDQMVEKGILTQEEVQMIYEYCKTLENT